MIWWTETSPYYQSHVNTYEGESRNHILLEVRIYSFCPKLSHQFLIIVLSAGSLRNPRASLGGQLFHFLMLANSNFVSTEFLKLVCYSVLSPVDTTEMSRLPGYHPLPVFIPVHWLFLFSLLCWIYLGHVLDLSNVLHNSAWKFLLSHPFSPTWPHSVLKPLKTASVLTSKTSPCLQKTPQTFL